MALGLRSHPLCCVIIKVTASMITSNLDGVPARCLMRFLRVVHVFVYLIFTQSYKGDTNQPHCINEPAEARLSKVTQMSSRAGILSRAQPGSVCALKPTSGQALTTTHRTALSFPASAHPVSPGSSAQPLPILLSLGDWLRGSGCLWSCSTQRQSQCSWWTWAVGSLGG